VLIPTRLPAVSISAPPELPGLIAASVWMKFLEGIDALVASERGHDSMVTVWPTPKGLPIASTTSPTARASASPKVIARKRNAFRPAGPRYRFPDRSRRLWLSISAVDERHLDLVGRLDHV